jgi:microcompartment protein CcmK/EutM
MTRLFDAGMTAKKFVVAATDETVEPTEATEVATAYVGSATTNSTAVATGNGRRGIKILELTVVPLFTV